MADRLDARQASRAAVSKLPSAKMLAWMLVRPKAALPPSDAAVIVCLEQDAEAALIADFAQRFTTLVRQCSVRSSLRHPDPGGVLDTWLADAGSCGVRVIATFATGIKRDGAAVRAALTTPWSNGQSEVQINRLKMLKRQMYGHASFDLLRRRVLLDR